MKVALYARVSTDNQASGLEAQVRALEAYCSANALTDFIVYRDEGISGTRCSRPALDAMMAAVEANEINQVIVYSFSRFARSTKHLLSALEVFNSKGVGFISLSEKLDTTSATGRAVFTIIAAISQLERELIGERVRNGLVNARSKGKVLGRPKTRNDELIKTLLIQGYTYRRISKLVHCSHWVIREVAKSLQSTSALTEQKASVG